MEDVLALICALVMVAVPVWAAGRSWRVRVGGRRRRAELRASGEQMRTIADQLTQTPSGSPDPQ